MTDNFPDEWIDKVCEADPLPDDFDPEDDEAIPTGLTLTPKEIEAACVELGRWQSVETFNRKERRFRLRNADPDFFVQPQLKFLHDAYVLAKFAARIGSARSPITRLRTCELLVAFSLIGVYWRNRSSQGRNPIFRP